MTRTYAGRQTREGATLAATITAVFSLVATTATADMRRFLPIVACTVMIACGSGTSAPTAPTTMVTTYTGRPHRSGVGDQGTTFTENASTTMSVTVG